ncbi:MAG: flagellar protein FliT [Candidatus Polarisedimenticolaceae bacterium]|nr:flagellar protein FliT [Candidatus Polarisedimenticolaceae bacterium]
MPSSDELLEQILEQSNKLHELILNGELEEAERLEQERSLLITACFASGSSFDNPQKAANSIQKIIDCDREAMAHGKQASAEMKGELARLQRGHQAVRAYHEASR